MTNSFLKMLYCPLCGNHFTISKEISTKDNKLKWGVVTCDGCNTKYPVAFGIPILKDPDAFVDVHNDFNVNDDVIQKGLRVKEIVVKIEAGELSEVQKELLLVRLPRTRLSRYRSKGVPSVLDTKLTRVLPGKVVKLIGKRKLYLVYWLLAKLSFENVRYKRREENTFRNLLEKETAVSFINLYFKQSHQSVLSEYFTNRFGMPRHLSVLSLLSVIPEDERPLLDIACGAGHLMHYFSKRNKNQPVIGMDRTFAQLYIAKEFVCPEGNYFCAEANQQLPFKEGTFSGVYCSDAFQYFPDRDYTTNEMQRVLINDGVICIARVSSQYNKLYIGNAVIPADQLKNHFKNMSSVVLEEQELLDGYIHKNGPDLSIIKNREELSRIKWSYIIASNNKDIFHKYDLFSYWPHEVGQLKLNPLYHKSGNGDNGNLIFEFKFPSGWYEYENHAWLSYAPKTIQISETTLNDLNKGKQTEEVNNLISKYVVLGMPENYL